MEWYFSDNPDILRCIHDKLGWQPKEESTQNLIGHFECAVSSPEKVDLDNLYAIFSNWMKYVDKYGDATQLYRVAAKNLVLSLPPPSDRDEVPFETGTNIINVKFGK